MKVNKISKKNVLNIIFNILDFERSEKCVGLFNMVFNVLIMYFMFMHIC